MPKPETNCWKILDYIDLLIMDRKFWLLITEPPVTTTLSQTSGSIRLMMVPLLACCGKHHIEILVSEVRDEHTTYAEWRPPKSDGLESIRTRLRADHHPEGVVYAILSHCSGGDFGRMYADVQVHLRPRGFASKLAKHGAGYLIKRVRTEWLAATAKRWTPKSMGVTHGTDSPIWYWGNGEKLENQEKGSMKKFVGDSFWTFVNGEDVQSTARWKGLNKSDLVRTLNQDGLAADEHDRLWEDGINFWEAVREASWSDSDSMLDHEA